LNVNLDVKQIKKALKMEAKEIKGLFLHQIAN